MSQDENSRATTLILVRHGETEANAARRWQGATNSPLNGKGTTQAQLVAQQLDHEGLAGSVVYSSPLGRAQQTASIIAEALGGDQVRIEPGLAEFNLGDWEGRSYDWLNDESRFAELGRNPDFSPPGGESGRQFTIRVVTALQSIAAAHPGERVVVVSHGGALATGMAALLGDDPRTWSEYGMDNCAIAELTLNPEPQLLRLNDSSHLSPARAEQ